MSVRIAALALEDRSRAIQGLPRIHDAEIRRAGYAALHAVLAASGAVGSQAPPLPPLSAIDWLRKHNALVRFESDGSVSVKVNRHKRRRPTLTEAIRAVESALGS